jgi:hypothetical protein
MLTEIKVDQVPGKVVDRFVFYEDRALVLFRDGTFTSLGVEACGSSLEITPVEFDLFYFGAIALIDGGVISWGELEVKKAEHDREFAERREVNERKRYEELKEKFESS